MHKCLDKKCSWENMDFIGLKGAAQGKNKKEHLFPPYALRLTPFASWAGKAIEC